SRWSLNVRPGFLRITTDAGDVGEKNPLVQAAPTGAYTITTRVVFTPTHNFQTAGLVLYQDNDNYLKLARTYCEDIPPPACVPDGIYFDYMEGGRYVGTSFTASTGTLSDNYLRVIRRGTTYSGYHSEDGVHWTLLGSHTPSSAVQLSKMGLTAAHDYQDIGGPADFDFFELELAPSRLFLPIIMNNSVVPTVDVIFHNGALLTMEGGSWDAQAIAIRGDTIIAVGSDNEILALQGEQTEVIDLGGRTLLPGFIDSHGHWPFGRPDMSPFASPQAAIQHAIEQGWTSINELFVTPERLNDLVALDSQGQLRLRVNAYLSVAYRESWWGHWYQQYQPRSYVSPAVRLAGVKMAIDHDDCQTINLTQAELDAAVLEAHRSGWQVAIHTIGKTGHQMVLDAFEKALQGEGNDQYRHRIEHVMVLRDDQVQRMSDLGIIASVQLRFPSDLPQFELDNLYYCSGADGLRLACRWRDLLAAGVPTVGGTDWPWYVAEMEGAPSASPLRLLYNAATRIGTTVQSPPSWMLDQTITVEQALPLLTINGAWGTFEEDVKGSLAPGKWADLVILSDNPLDVPVEDLPEIQVLMTMIGGRVEYCAPGLESLCPGAPPGDQVVVPPGQVIQVALVGPESGDWPGLLDLFQAMHATSHMAIEDYGEIRGFALEVTGYDDRCDPSLGASAATAVVRSGQNSAVLGPMCSPPAIGGLPTYESAGIVLVSPSATRPDLPSFGPAVFNRTVLNDAQILAEGLGSDAYIEALPSVQAFYADYRSRTGQEPPPGTRHYLAYTYDAAMILLRAIEQVAVLRGDGALVVPRQALANAVRSTTGFQGVTGTISFDSQGNRVPDSEQGG
ncbi:MAG: amidohydrolase family protein, partial [Anaerolineales bacterium]